MMVYFKAKGLYGVGGKMWKAECSFFKPLPPAEQLDVGRGTVGGSWWMPCYTDTVFFCSGVIEVFFCFLFFVLK